MSEQIHFPEESEQPEERQAALEASDVVGVAVISLFLASVGLVTFLLTAAIASG